jgi:hypothetical protein
VGGVEGKQFEVGKFGPILEWTPTGGWTRDGEKFSPDPPPISDGLLGLLAHTRSPLNRATAVIDLHAEGLQG